MALAPFELTILMPCLNEAETLASCIRKARTFLCKNQISGEILIADNGSTDKSPDIAQHEGARVIAVPEKGYGNALIAGIQAAQGKFIIMGDSDDSYDFTNLDGFVKLLRDGNDLVMGNRFQGGISPGAMPFLHRYLGNPVLSGLGRFFFNIPVGDFHCGLRGFNRESIQNLNLKAPGMEFASEMVVLASLNGLKITEVPTTLVPDGRKRKPHLNTWRDGWRHLQFLLLHSPDWLFLYPGAAAFSLGIIGFLFLLPQAQTVLNVTFDVHSLLYCSVLLTAGLQIMLFGIYAKLISATVIKTHSLDKILPFFLDCFTLERGLITGFLFLLCGLAGALYSIVVWEEHAFGGLIPSEMMRLVIPAATAFSIGLQIIFASFFAVMLGVKK